MQLSTLKEAAYKAPTRGSFEWILKSFFIVNGNTFGNYFDVRPEFIALHQGKQITNVDIDRTYEIEVFFYPLIGEAYKPDDPTSIEIYQAKQVN